MKKKLTWGFRILAGKTELLMPDTHRYSLLLKLTALYSYCSCLALSSAIPKTLQARFKSGENWLRRGNNAESSQEKRPGLTIALSATLLQRLEDVRTTTRLQRAMRRGCGWGTTSDVTCPEADWATPTSTYSLENAVQLASYILEVCMFEVLGAPGL